MGNDKSLPDKAAATAASNWIAKQAQLKREQEARMAYRGGRARAARWQCADAKVRVSRKGWTRLAIVYALLAAVLCAGVAWVVIDGGSIIAILSTVTAVLGVVSYVRYQYNGGRLRFSSWLTRNPRDSEFLTSVR
jgi:hypothetical protein